MFPWINNNDLHIATFFAILTPSTLMTMFFILVALLRYPDYSHMRTFHTNTTTLEAGTFLAITRQPLQLESCSN